MYQTLLSLKGICLCNHTPHSTYTFETHKCVNSYRIWHFVYSMIKIYILLIIVKK